jgi:hypothetical protein
MDFEENNEEFEGKVTRNLKEKHREFFTREFKRHLYLFFSANKISDKDIIIIPNFLFISFFCRE